MLIFGVQDLNKPLKCVTCPVPLVLGMIDTSDHVAVLLHLYIVYLADHKAGKQSHT